SPLTVTSRMRPPPLSSTRAYPAELARSEFSRLPSSLLRAVEELSLVAHQVTPLPAAAPKSAAQAASITADRPSRRGFDARERAIEGVGPSFVSSIPVLPVA